MDGDTLEAVSVERVRLSMNTQSLVVLTISSKFQWKCEQSLKISRRYFQRWLGLQLGASPDMDSDTRTRQLVILKKHRRIKWVWQKEKKKKGEFSGGFLSFFSSLVFLGSLCLASFTSTGGKRKMNRKVIRSKKTKSQTQTEGWEDRLELEATMMCGDDALFLSINIFHSRG